MIDLNEFKKSVVRVKSSHLINVFISDFDEIIDRAIAAESECDELKAKLAEIDMSGIYNIIRDIVHNYECGDEVDNKLKPLLAKLNEHREPESKPEASVDDNPPAFYYETLAQNPVLYRWEEINIDDQHLFTPLWTEQVSPNKAEVPDWRKHAAKWIQDKAIVQNEINKANPEHTKTYPYFEHKVRELNWLAAELLMPLPPLKDE